MLYLKMKENAFIFNVPDIKKAGFLNASIEIEPEEFEDAFPGRKVIQKVSADVSFQSAGENIVLTGKVIASLSFECARCGNAAVKNFSDDFDGCYPDTLEYINIREDIRETLSLMEPMKFLCSENCKGRCPQCGADLNKGKCSCVQEKFSPFEALKNFNTAKNKK